MSIKCRLEYGYTDYCGEQCKWGCHVNPDQRLSADKVEKDNKTRLPTSDELHDIQRTPDTFQPSVV